MILIWKWSWVHNFVYTGNFKALTQGLDAEQSLWAPPAQPPPRLPWVEHILIQNNSQAFRPNSHMYMKSRSRNEFITTIYNGRMWSISGWRTGSSRWNHRQRWRSSLCPSSTGASGPWKKELYELRHHYCHHHLCHQQHHWCPAEMGVMHLIQNTLERGSIGRQSHSAILPLS